MLLCPNISTPRLTPKRIGFDGTPRTPSQELLRSTASSRGQQIRRKQLDYPSNLTDRHLELNIQLSPKKHSIVIARTDRTRTKDNLSPILPFAKDIKATSYGEPLTDINTLSLLDSHALESEDEYTDSSFVREMEFQNSRELVTISSCTIQSNRKFLENPVAITLLNDGEEDLGLFLNYDRVLHPDQPKLQYQGFHKDSHNDSSPIVKDYFLTHSPNDDVRKVSGSLLDIMSDQEVSALARPIAVLAKRG